MKQAEEPGSIKREISRKSWLSILAKSSFSEIQTLWEKLELNLEWELIRKPEIGMVMVQGRTGGNGQAFNLGEIFNKIMGFANGITFLSLIVGIATILAGVIGIGNILLISVKERTKELGIRRALGATPREVRSLIILESVFLTMIAGVIGIILGAGVLSLINNLTKDIDFPYTNPTVPIPYVLGALALMIILGTLIGSIPAQRAVSIKPIDALREE